MEQRDDRISNHQPDLNMEDSHAPSFFVPTTWFKSILHDATNILALSSHSDSS